MGTVAKNEPAVKVEAEKLAKPDSWKPRITERTMPSGAVVVRADWWEKKPGGGYTHKQTQRATRRELEDWVAGEQKRLKSEMGLIHKAERRGDNVITLANLSPTERAALAQAVETIRKAGGRVEALADASRVFASTHLTGAKITVADLRAEHLEAMQKQGKRPPTIRDRRLYLADFVATYGDTLAATVTKAQAEDWIFDADTPATQASRRRALHALFNYAMRREYMERNPVSTVEKPRELGPDKVDIFTPAEVEALLRAAQKTEPRLVPYFAIGIFAGLRPQNELRLLDWENINLESGLLTVTRRTSKTARVRHVPIQPNLRAWLETVPKSKRKGRLFYSRRAFFRVLGRDWPQSKSRLERAAKAARAAKKGFKLPGPEPTPKPKKKEKPLRWGADIMRHSFCSFRQAVIKNIAQLCHEAGNTPAVAAAHYLNPRGSAAEVEKFWSILPTPAKAQRRKGNRP